MIDNIAAWVLFGVAQAFATQAQTLPPPELPSTAVATADDVGGPPTAPPLASRIARTSPADIAVPALVLFGTFMLGRATGLVSAKKEGKA